LNNISTTKEMLLRWVDFLISCLNANRTSGYIAVVNCILMWKLLVGIFVAANIQP